MKPDTNTLKPYAALNTSLQAYSVHNLGFIIQVRIDMVFDNNKPVQQITSEAQLRRLVAKYPKILDKRLLSELDGYCLELIEHSTLCICAFSQADTPMMTLLTQDLVIAGRRTLYIPHNHELDSGCERLYASLYFLVPGIGHGLRVNGHVEVRGHQCILKINKAYLHCARAAARAELWQAPVAQYQTKTGLPSFPKDFLAQSPYLLLKTMNKNGETELSPRGDQPGFVYLINESSLFLPERPGNKVAVSLRNILQNSFVELLMLIPGTDFVMHVYGKAAVTKDKQLLSLCAVGNKRPKLGIRLTECKFLIEQNQVLQQENTWSLENHVSPERVTRFSKALSAHMNGEGLIGKATSPFIEAVVRNDMKNLY